MKTEEIAQETERIRTALSKLKAADIAIDNAMNDLANIRGNAKRLDAIINVRHRLDTAAFKLQLWLEDRDHAARADAKTKEGLRTLARTFK